MGRLTEDTKTKRGRGLKGKKIIISSDGGMLTPRFS